MKRSAVLPRQSTPSVPWAKPTHLNVGLSSVSLFDSNLTLQAAATKISPRPVGRPAAASARRDNWRGAASWTTRSISWQNEVFAAYGQVGELHYAVNQIARAASRCFVVPNDSRTDTGPESPTSSATSPQRPDTSLKAEQVFRAVLLLKLVGEYYMVSMRNDPDPKNIEILSPVEVIWDKNDGTATLPGRWGTYNPKGLNNIRLTRVHQPDAAIWVLADSAPRALLPILRELIGLTMHVSACIDSRLVGAGALFVPAGASAVGTNSENEGMHDADMPLTDALLEAGAKAIQNRDEASAHVPVIVELPDDVGADAVKFVSFAVPLDAQATTLRDECVRRLAIGLDVPPEILLGMQNTTSHFATWSVQDEFVRMHIEPALEDVVNGFDVHTDTPWTYDPSPLKRMPNLAAEAVQLYDRGELSGDSLRYATGFSDQDAPKNITGKDAFEQQAWDKLESLLAKSPSLAQTPGIPAVLSQIKAAMRDESPENALYPDQPIIVSEDEVPRGPGAENEAPQNIPDRSEPRAAAPAERPRPAERRSDGSQNVGERGRPHDLPADR